MKHAYSPDGSGGFVKKFSDPQFLDNAVADLMSNTPRLTKEILEKHKKTLSDAYMKKNRPQTRLVVFMPTLEYISVPQISVNIPGLKIGSFNVTLRFGGSGQLGRLFGLGFQFSKESYTQLFHMDYHKYHGNGWKSGDFHYQVSH